MFVLLPRLAQGAGVDIQIDATRMENIGEMHIDGLVPVIINITPLPSILPLLGLQPAIREEKYELSQLN